MREARDAGSSGRVHTVRIRVDGGYEPSVVHARVAEPLRLVFSREETTACSEHVVFPDFGKSAMLPPFEDVAVDLLPERAGESEFTCQFGMLRGRLVVEEAAPGTMPRAPRRPRARTLLAWPRSDRASSPALDRSPFSGRVSAALVATWGAATGALPHVLHHVGPLAGAALLAGATGRAVFALVGFAVAIPFLRRLRRRFGTWKAPAVALAVFASAFAVSSFVIGPAIAGDDGPGVQQNSHADHH